MGIVLRTARMEFIIQKRSTSFVSKPSIIGIDFTIDEQMHLAVGFDNGTIEIRKHRTGELLHSVKAGDKPIQKLFYYDYRLSGEKSSSGGKQLIAVDSEGNVKGFTVSANIKQFELQV